MSKTVKIGVFGTKRGCAFIDNLLRLPNVEIVALCDKDAKALENAVKKCPAPPKTFCNFDEFIETEMDGVVLTNYFDEHTPFAIKAMNKGIHILSETTPANSMKECVDLCRTVENTGCKYMLAENYPFMCACLELERVYQDGTLGQVLYAEGEYVHPMSIEESNHYAPDLNHWRMRIPRTYYNTHSLAPLMHITKTIPKKVNAKTVFYPQYAYDRKRYSGDVAGIMLCEMDNGSLFRVTGSCSFGPHGNWYRLGCINGGIETVRGDQSLVKLDYNEWSKPEGKDNLIYKAEWQEQGELAEKAGHGGGDFWVVYNFIKYLTDDIEPFFNVYRSVAMSAVAILGWKSVLNDGMCFNIPDFTNEAERKLFENDTASPFPDQYGHSDMPYSSKPFYPVYE